MYTYVWRSAPHPSLTVFDAPDGNCACTRRNRSNTPLQALTLLNDPAYVECAKMLGQRMLKDREALGRARDLKKPEEDAKRLAYGFRLNPRDVPSPLVGRPAAPFSLTTLEGQPLSLADQRGKVVVLNFWASWCHPACYDEAPALERTWLAYKDKGVMVIGVNVQDTEEPARKFRTLVSVVP